LTSGIAKNFQALKQFSILEREQCQRQGKAPTLSLPRKKAHRRKRPLLAETLHKFGASVKYSGTLRDCVNHLFQDFVDKSSEMSTGHSGETRGVEFSDGIIAFQESYYCAKRMETASWQKHPQKAWLTPSTPAMLST
jgi:hypothetical protein